jgi:hypothetical protein
MALHASRAVRPDTWEAFWLNELKQAHADLLGSIDELARLTQGPVPDKQQLIEVRWAVSAASLARRLLWGRILAILSRRTPPSVARDLQALQEIDIKLIRASVNHVGRWTADAVIQDWPGYCRASEHMREMMIEAVAAEKRLLYPILEAFESGCSA